MIKCRLYDGDDNDVMIMMMMMTVKTTTINAIRMGSRGVNHCTDRN